MNVLNIKKQKVFFLITGMLSYVRIYLMLTWTADIIIFRPVHTLCESS